MDRKFGLYIVLGLVIRAVFGMGVGAASGNTIFGIGLGALFGVFVGWFVAAALENRKKNK
jgi:ABC-type antimicrobial peptide transport system permease subunit